MKLLAESWVAESWGKQSFQENERVTDSRAKAQRRGTATQSLIGVAQCPTLTLAARFPVVLHHKMLGTNEISIKICST